MFKLDEILDKVKELHSHSILNNNEYYTEKLLQIIIDLSTIDNVKSEVDEKEIEKVKRKVPKWMKKKHQYNYRILKVFMDISNHNEHSVSVDELEKYSEIDPKIFLGHYNGMKTISVKNHGKLFDEVDKRVKLWEPVAEFIIGTFTEKCFMDKNNTELNFRAFAEQTVDNKSTIDGYIQSLTEDFPSKLNINNILNIVDIDFLEKLYKRCSVDGDLYEWSYAIGNGRPMSAIKKYIDFLTKNK